MAEQWYDIVNDSRKLKAFIDAVNTHALVFDDETGEYSAAAGGASLVGCHCYFTGQFEAESPYGYALMYPWWDTDGFFVPDPLYPAIAGEVGDRGHVLQIPTGLGGMYEVSVAAEASSAGAVLIEVDRNREVAEGWDAGGPDGIGLPYKGNWILSGRSSSGGWARAIDILPLEDDDYLEVKVTGAYQYNDDGAFQSHMRIRRLGDLQTLRWPLP